MHSHVGTHAWTYVLAATYISTLRRTNNALEGTGYRGSGVAVALAPPWPYRLPCDDTSFLRPKHPSTQGPPAGKRNGGERKKTRPTGKKEEKKTWFEIGLGLDGLEDRPRYRGAEVGFEGTGTCHVAWHVRATQTLTNQKNNYFLAAPHHYFFFFFKKRKRKRKRKGETSFLDLENTILTGKDILIKELRLDYLRKKIGKKKEKGWRRATYIAEAKILIIHIKHHDNKNDHYFIYRTWEKA